MAKAICLVMKVQPTEIKSKVNNYVMSKCYWTSLQSNQLLGDYRILQRLTSIMPQEISQDVIFQIAVLMEESNVNEASITHSSLAAKGLYQWIRAVRMYYIVYHDSAPARDKLIKSDI